LKKGEYTDTEKYDAATYSKNTASHLHPTCNSGDKPMTPARILVVEDEPMIANTMQQMLEFLGYSVPETADSAEEALEKAGRLEPALILMDIQLRGKQDGVAAAQLIQERFDIPIIFLTGHSDHHTLNRIKMAGPSGYLLKPPETKELHMAIEMALYKHQTERRLRDQQQWLSTILTSIGDAVIATNEQGNIAFMNPVAEKLTGWLQADAAGQPLAAVFRVVDRHTMEPISDLVRRVMDGRQALTIANDTLLVRKDGEALPVENTTAPIIGGQDKILGVVLVFHDVTRRKLAEGELHLYQENLEALVAERTTALEAMNTLLQREIAERKLAQEMMIIQTQQLAQSNAELEQFAYVASHDLREPLRKINSYTELLAKRYEGQLDERADKYIDYIVDGTIRMQQLITELLMYSRLGRVTPDPAPTNLSELLSGVLSDLELTIEETGAEITADPLPTLTVDARQIGRLFQNLLGNALKFRGSRPPSIQIAARQQKNEWIFSISDNGIGIEAQYLERIFLIFQRLHTRSEYPGTGIGLAVCKKIVENHNGRIWVESEPGKGTAFHFTLPVPSQSS
jgi:PAS domain S-box-containing protein